MRPYMDGFEVLQNLKKSLNTRDIPVIMLTARAQDADVFRGWQSGVPELHWFADDEEEEDEEEISQ